MSLRLERAVFLSFHGVVFFIGVVHIAPPHVVMMRGVFCADVLHNRVPFASFAEHKLERNGKRTSVLLYHAR